MKPYLQLNWGIENPLIKEWTVPTSPDPNNCYMWNYPLQFVVNPSTNLLLKKTFNKISNRHPEVFKKLENQKDLIIFDTFSIFYTPANSVRNIHIDGDGVDEKNDWGINFVLDQSLDDLMSWYRSKSSDKKDNVSYTVAGTPYFGYHPSDVELIDSCSLKGYTLVNVGIPHGIVNNGPGPRYAISLRSRTLGKLFSYEQMYNFLKDLEEI